MRYATGKIRTVSLELDGGFQIQTVTAKKPSVPLSKEILCENPICRRNKSGFVWVEARTGVKAGQLAQLIRTRCS